MEIKRRILKRFSAALSFLPPHRLRIHKKLCIFFSSPQNTNANICHATFCWNVRVIFPVSSFIFHNMWALQLCSLAWTLMLTCHTFDGWKMELRNRLRKFNRPSWKKELRDKMRKFNWPSEPDKKTQGSWPPLHKLTCFREKQNQQIVW